jgi:hypothetical protein
VSGPYTQDLHTGDASASASAFLADGSRVAEEDVAPWLAQMAQHALTLRPHADVEGLAITVRWRPSGAVRATNQDEPEVA